METLKKNFRRASWSSQTTKKTLTPRKNKQRILKAETIPLESLRFCWMFALFRSLQVKFCFHFQLPKLLFKFLFFTWTRWNEEHKSVFINLLHTWRKTSPPNELTLTCLLISPFEPCPSQKQRMLNSFWPKVTIYFWSEENGTQISYRPSSSTVPSTPKAHPTSQPGHPLPLAQESSSHSVMA